MKILFTTSSPLGYTVSCSQHRWDNHVLPTHPNMLNKEKIVSETISNPVVIYQSNEYNNSDVYFGSSGDNNSKLKYTKVIVANNSKNDSDVVSAWIQPDISGNINPEVIKHVKPKL